MEECKRYFWMRMRADFFEDDAIDYLEEQENGHLYTLFYIKLCLKSLKTEGVLYRSVGDSLIPYSYEKLAKATRTPLDTVVVAMELLKKIGLVKVLANGFFDIPQVRTLIGSEAANDHAQRQKRYRERKKLEKLDKNVAIFLDGVTESVTISDGTSDGVTSLNSDYI